MAKKNRGSGFDRFGNKGPSPSGGPAVVDVPEEDESDVDEPTDTVPAEELPPVPDTGDGTAGRETPQGAYRRIEREAMQAATVAEQEQIRAKMHPPCTIEDPAIHYKAALVKGRSLPEYTAKPGTDPLLVRAKDWIERILAGGLLPPTAYGVYNLGVDLAAAIIKQTKQETPDAESGQGSSGGNSEVGG